MGPSILPERGTDFVVVGMSLQRRTALNRYRIRHRDPTAENLEEWLYGLSVL